MIPNSCGRRIASSVDREPEGFAFMFKHPDDAICVGPGAKVPLRQAFPTVPRVAAARPGSVIGREADNCGHQSNAIGGAGLVRVRLGADGALFRARTRRGSQTSTALRSTHTHTNTTHSAPNDAPGHPRRLYISFVLVTSSRALASDSAGKLFQGKPVFLSSPRLSSKSPLSQPRTRMSAACPTRLGTLG